MMFLLRAAFWLAVVSFFVPQDFAGDAIDLPFNTAETRLDATAKVSDWCAENEVICEAGSEAARLGSFLGEMAVSRIGDAIEDHQERQTASSTSPTPHAPTPARAKS
ncbi:hypothetical protein AWH62_10785 [Maricaulis sp. W15]|uniref:Uncharacterized protein n=1 Tax=Maricaulis maris TaxID=74318 RepID=A0A495D162_9PROT|nr:MULTISPECIES: hypothetical protein [Maricaulis]OLF72312.1 hypothetical protein AWH62_10785 [Maricaulis sp. W15]RKQ95217.1 hypothetical protein C7435_2906 [Maricaulis maris]